jgi:hypothetical protein
MELADVEPRLRQNAFGLSERIVFGAHRCRTGNGQTNSGSGLRLYRLASRSFCASLCCQTASDAADVRSQAGNTECDPGVFFQPFANAFHALSSFQCCFNVRPECPDLTGFGRRLLGAVTGKPCASESNPVKQRLRVTRSPHHKPPFLTAMASALRDKKSARLPGQRF